MLIVPFLSEEMDLVIKEMPAHKAPGPDGFNGIFLKRCWSLIKEDFYKLARDFHDVRFSLESINASYITLVPKIQCPEEVNDFRPISLTNVCLKFITELAANRLQNIILKCLHKNHYGFLKARSVQYCVSWAFEYLYLRHASKKSQ